MIRRITTGLVAIALARTSDVTGPGCSAMCRRMWSTPDNLLSLLMSLHMLHDTAEVVKLRLQDEPVEPLREQAALGGGEGGRHLGQHGLEGDGVGGGAVRSGPRGRPTGGYRVRGHRREDRLAGQGRHGEIALRVLDRDEREDDADPGG